MRLDLQKQAECLDQTGKATCFVWWGVVVTQVRRRPSWVCLIGSLAMCRYFCTCTFRSLFVLVVVSCDNGDGDDAQNGVKICPGCVAVAGPPAGQVLRWLVKPSIGHRWVYVWNFIVRWFWGLPNLSAVD